MLRTLRVRDLAIIEELELLLEPGLNVVTGETGAGKSILLQALDVALGGRPDADLVRSGAEEGVVEAQFTAVAPAVRAVLEAAGLPTGDGDDELVVRRVIARGGRSRAWVNGALGSLTVLRELAPHVLRVYGQDEHQALRRVESHRELLDAIGGLGTSLKEMRTRQQAFVDARTAVAEARAEREAASERAELLRSQHAEIERANLVPGEEDQLGAERRRLIHAERLAQLGSQAEGEIYSGETAAVGAAGRALTALREAERLDPALEPTRKLVEAVVAELEEAGGALRRYTEDVTRDPERLERVEDRLALLARLRRKYGGTADELIRRRDELAADLATAADGDSTLAILESEAEDAERAAREWARRLSVERRRVAHELSRSLAGELHALALENARFTVRFGEGEERAVGPDGWDEVEFFLTANTGEEARPLAKVASGGELSRIMLALKALAAADDRGASLIFDEVDTGIGGAVAEVVGRKLRQLARTRQVLCITHLPLIAAFADHHVAVAKEVREGRTISSARPLASNERVGELARMMGGARVTPEAKEHAEELLRRAAARRGARTGRQTLTDRSGVE
jgi:DNA repair protein RecN (Recombination protein N)